MGVNEPSGELSHSDTPTIVPVSPTNNAVFDKMGEARILSRIAEYLKPDISDLMNFTLSCRACFQDVGVSFQLWRGVYCASEPLMLDELKKKLLNDEYCDHTELIGPETLKYSVWLRTCALLRKKANIISSLFGKDPVVVRALGEPESSAREIHLGIDYHLDTYEEEDQERFAAEFPQKYQDLKFGDIVISDDYRGAGCWTAIRESQSTGKLILHKNSYDSSGYGILCKTVGPPTFPLFYYCDMKMEDKFDKQALMEKEIDYFMYSQLKDDSFFSWAEQTIVDEM